MSRQSEAKAAQGYDPKPVPNTCANCGHFSTVRVLPTLYSHYNMLALAAGRKPPYTLKKDGIEGSPRCSLGDFAVNKCGTCNKFSEPVTT